MAYIYRPTLLPRPRPSLPPSLSPSLSPPLPPSLPPPLPNPLSSPSFLLLPLFPSLLLPLLPTPPPPPPPSSSHSPPPFLPTPTLLSVVLPASRMVLDLLSKASNVCGLYPHSRGQQSSLLHHSQLPPGQLPPPPYIHTYTHTHIHTYIHT